MSEIKNMKKSVSGKIDPETAGIAGGFGLLLLYLILLSLLNSPDHAIDQFFSMWYWILALAAGFGIQIGLYTYVKQSALANAASGEIAATGGISAGSMISCCLHHVTDVIPLIGLSAAALFVAQYTTQFMILGVASNIVGITMMLGIIQKHNLFDKKFPFEALFRHDMNTVRNIAIVLSAAVILASFYFANPASSSALDLPEKTNSENAAAISAKPVDFRQNTPVKFDITLTAHQGSLDHDMTKVSVLKDAEGNTYLPLSWDGSPPGGHHRSGTLTFPQLKGKTSAITLIIKGIYDVPERIYTWQLNG